MEASERFAELKQQVETAESKELCDSRHKKQKEEVDAKLADLRAKLSRHKEPAATS